MKKQIFGICIVVLMLVALVSGCTENKTTDNGGGATGNTYTMTAKEVQNDMTMDSDWSTYVKILFNSLEDGDTLIIHDTIDDISHSSDTDRTTITFNTSEGGDMTSSLNYPFEGDITGSYQIGDEVKITATIKHVEATYEQDGSSMDYELEIFEEMWTNMDEYIATQGGALPTTSIEKIE